MSYACRSREGAWIEIIKGLQLLYDLSVAPVRERGLKYFNCVNNNTVYRVAPVRERGLKFLLEK